MGIARDKRTGQTWMWPPEEENDANEEFGVAPDDKPTRSCPTAPWTDAGRPSRK